MQHVMEGRDPAGSGFRAMTVTYRRICTHPENEGRRLRRLAGWVGWQAWQRTVGRPWKVPLHDGLRMICHPHDTVTSLALYCGLYDAEEMRFLLAWLQEGDTFVDVGANVGPYTLLSTLVPGTRAVAFEPGSLARQRLLANLRLNGLDEQVEVVAKAVGADDGTALLSADRWATNSLVDGTYDGGTEQVDLVSLDGHDARTPLGRIGLVKIDVEGHELAVLQGAAGVLRRDRPALIVELNDVAALRSWTESAGYTAVGFLPRSGAVEPRAWPTVRGGNILLVPDLDAARQRVAGI